MSVKHLCLVAVAAAIGCSSAHGASGPQGTSAVSRRTNLLTADEIVAAKADLVSAYDAVARLRPNWLAAHGLASLDLSSNEFAVVYVDGTKYGGLESLRNIPAYQVASLRYYDVTQAGATFGLKAGTGGVIEVTTK
jgi:hypothetical protein